MINTLRTQWIRYIVFKDHDTCYAVGLECNIVESGEDPRIALCNLFDAIEGYEASLRKVNASDHSWMQVTDPAYEKMWKRRNALRNTTTKSAIYTFGNTRY